MSSLRATRALRLCAAPPRTAFSLASDGTIEASRSGSSRPARVDTTSTRSLRASGRTASRRSGSAARRYSAEATMRRRALARPPIKSLKRRGSPRQGPRSSASSDHHSWEPWAADVMTVSGWRAEKVAEYARIGALAGIRPYPADMTHSSGSNPARLARSGRSRMTRQWSPWYTSAAGAVRVSASPRRRHHRVARVAAGRGDTVRRRSPSETGSDFRSEQLATMTRRSVIAPDRAASTRLRQTLSDCECFRDSQPGRGTTRPARHRASLKRRCAPCPQRTQVCRTPPW